MSVSPACDEPEDDAGGERRHADIGLLPQHAEQEPAEEELLGERRRDAGHEADRDEQRQRVLGLELGDEVLLLRLAEQHDDDPPARTITAT